MKRKIVNLHVIERHVLILTSIDEKINTFIELPYKEDISESLNVFRKCSVYSELDEVDKIKFDKLQTLDDLYKLRLITPEKYRLIYRESSGINSLIENVLDEFSDRYTDSFEEDVDKFEEINIEINKIIHNSDNVKLSAIIIDGLLYIDEKLFNSDFSLMNSELQENRFYTIKYKNHNTAIFQLEKIHGDNILYYVICSSVAPNNSSNRIKSDVSGSFKITDYEDILEFRLSNNTEINKLVSSVENTYKYISFDKKFMKFEFKLPLDRIKFLQSEGYIGLPLDEDKMVIYDRNINYFTVCPNNNNLCKFLMIERCLFNELKPGDVFFDDMIYTDDMNYIENYNIKLNMDPVYNALYIINSVPTILTQKLEDYVYKVY